MSEASLKLPSVMRYKRVQLVLEQEPAFVAQMGDRSVEVAVCKPTGEKAFFAPQVVAVTQAIHTAGKDPHKVHKNEIVKFAIKVFGIGQPKAEPVTNGAIVETPAPAPEPPPEPTPAAPPPVAVQAKPAKTTPKPPAKSKPAAVALAPVQVKKAAPKAAAPKKDEPKPEPPKAVAVAAPVVATPPEKDRKSVVQAAKDMLQQERPGENAAAFNAFISMYSLLVILLQLFELYDNQPGNEKRLKTVDELAKEINKFTAVKSAKEAQKA